MYLRAGVSITIGAVIVTAFANSSSTLRGMSSVRALSTSVRPPLKLLSQYSNIPHPDKAYKGGEDGYYVGNNGLSIGVADGVGGWADSGVDPGKYSKSLMKWAKDFADNGQKHTPVSILQYAYDKTKGIIGSSTACILVLNPDQHQITSANLGDSGYMIVREGRVIYKTMEQTKGFNFPFQLGTNSHDYPKDSSVITTDVKHGDFIVMGSDGLFDNMYNEEILFTLETGIAEALGQKEPILCTSIEHGRRPTLLSSQDTTPAITTSLINPDNFNNISNLMKSNDNHLAKVIGERAMLNGHSKSIETPFAKSAKEHGYRYNGGKLDDVTVILSFVDINHPNSSL